MDPNGKDKTLDNLTKAENILVASSDDSGFDGLSAALAIYLSLVKLGKSASVIAHEPSVGDAQRIYGVDKIGKSKTKQMPVVVIQNAIDSVDNVTYFLEEEKLKVVIHPLPGGPGVTKEQISLEYSAAPANLIFAIGFQSRQELQEKITHEQQISPETWIISINKGELKQKFAQDGFLDPESSSVSQVTTAMLQELALPVDEDIAFNLYTAIAQSSQNFSPSLTSPRTFEIASWLVKFGAGKASLAQKTQTVLPARDTIRDIQPKAQMPRPPIKTVDDFFQSMPQLEDVTAIEDVERSAEAQSKDWLKPPKMYKGSKSFGEGKD